MALGSAQWQEQFAQNDLPFNSVVGERVVEAEAPVVPLDSAVGEGAILGNVHFSAADVDAIQNLNSMSKLREVMFDPTVKDEGPTQRLASHFCSPYLDSLPTPKTNRTMREPH